MKVIPKFDSGGGMPPLSYFTPVTVPNQGAYNVTTQQDTQSDNSTNKNSSSGQITDKDLLELANSLDGLPSDMNILINNLYRFYQLDSLLGQENINSSQLSGKYLQTLGKLKTINFNKQQYDKAFTRVAENEGLNEAAITQTGKIIVFDASDGKMKQVTSKEYLNNKDSYQLLTNSNLLSLRAENPQFAFNNESLAVVNNGIGVKAITEMINNVIANLGESTISREGYSYKKGNKILKGIELLQEASQRGMSLDGMSLDGMYKSKLITKDQYKQIEEALIYIYKTLPTNAKTLLELKSDNAEDPQKGSIEVIKSLLMSKSKPSIEFNPEYQQDMDEDGSSKKDKKELDNIDSNQLLNIVQGDGGEYGRFELNVGNSVKMGVDSISYSLHSIKDKLPITQTSLQNLLVDSGLMGIVSQNGAITFGDQIIDPSDFKNIVYRGNGVSKVILPITYVDGKQVPDFSIMDRYLKAQTELRQFNNLPESERLKKQGEVLYKHKLFELIDPYTGLPNLNAFKEFVVVDAYGSDKDDLIKDTPFVEEVDKDNKIYQDIEKILSTKDDPYELSTLWGFGDSIYSGVVYIPINNNKLQAITAYGQSVDTSIQKGLETDYQQFIKKQSSRSTRADAL